jgi:hypothetical protein
MNLGKNKELSQAAILKVDFTLIDIITLVWLARIVWERVFRSAVWPMSRVMFFTDAFNVYHFLTDDPKYHKYL